METMTLREQAEKQVEEGLCDACDAIGCNMQSICDGFKDDVDAILKEWATEDAARETEALKGKE